MAKPTAARIMSIACGGQTLMTAEAREDLGETTLQVESHGHWMLKGVSNPMELFEAGAAGARFVVPSDGDKAFRVVLQGERWLPVKDIPNNLPHQVTSFIGRGKELDDIKSLLVKTRLVTLLGMGGLGKTRLSLQAAAETISRYPDGVWFLDLSPIRDPALVVSEAAQVLDLREEPGRPLIQTVCAHLRKLKVLFVVDNCEHLIQACANLAAAILKAAPDVRMVTSSREALRVPGEQAYPILPLPVPSKDDSIETLAGMTAVRLFVERAKQHKPAFELNEREAPAVAELVARLEGIPLALELAAARVRAMSVADINRRLNDRYKFLVGGGRVLQERQQTLRALVDWSYEMLSEFEQTVLQRLAVFAGGFDLEAAEQVCGVDPVESFEVLDLLASLVEKSLVMLDERKDDSRYRMLDTIADYAREKLAQSDGTEVMAAKHCDHYFALAKAANRGLNGPQQVESIKRMELELDNIRSALVWAQVRGPDATVAVKIVVAMLGFWLLRGYGTEGRNAVRVALEMPGVQDVPVAKAHAMYAGAALAASQSDHAEAQQLLEACLALRRELDNPADVAATLSTLALARFGRGDAEGALECEQEALALFRENGHETGEVAGLVHLGQIYNYLGDDESARAHLTQGLSLARSTKYHEAEAECELMLGRIDYGAGDAEAAARRFDRAMAICQTSADKHGEANAHWWQGKLAMQRGDLDTAHARLIDALTAFRAFEMRMDLLLCLRDLSILLGRLGHPDVGASIAATACAGLDRLQYTCSDRADQQWKAQLDLLQADFSDPSAFAAAWSEGAEADLDGVVTKALKLKPHAMPTSMGH
jgi:predicted ATPase